MAAAITLDILAILGFKLQFTTVASLIRQPGAFQVKPRKSVITGEAGWSIVVSP